MRSIKKLTLVINEKKNAAKILAGTLAQQSKALGVEVTCFNHYPLPQGFLEDQDACCILGGDGTLLGVVEEATEKQVPCFGINQGKLGFLATLSQEDIQKVWARLLEGHFNIQPRSVLVCKDAFGKSSLALNDIVIKNNTVSRLIDLEVQTNNKLITRYSCDGLIFATPTGSTAYNLSAGGPIIHPMTKALAMTPICPHTLSNRSVILPDDIELTVHYSQSEGLPQLTLDGRLHSDKQEAFPIHVALSPKSFPLLQFQDYDYFQIVRNKLNWG